MSRKVFLLAAWAMIAFALGPIGCGDDGGGGTAAQGGAGPEGWGASSCGTCVKDACAAEIDACAGDPGCAQYLQCLYGCAVGATGDADAGCEAACPVPDSSTAQAAKAALSDCRAYGPGATQCPGCGIETNTDPLLNQDCPASMETNGCYKCEDEHCCETYATCKANPACDALGQCLQACPAVGYEACRDQCEADNAGGIADFGARIGCVTVYCAEPDACGDVPLDECSKCNNTLCGDELIACWADAECYLLSECVAPCGANEVCFQACFAAHPDGVGKFTDFGLCTTQLCGAECG